MTAIYTGLFDMQESDVQNSGGSDVALEATAKSKPVAQSKHKRGFRWEDSGPEINGAELVDKEKGVLPVSACTVGMKGVLPVSACNFWNGIACTCVSADAICIHRSLTMGTASWHILLNRVVIFGSSFHSSKRAWASLQI
jgi:hypothetical protein